MASDNAIQGKDAVLSFLKEIYLPYVCATNFSIEFTGTTIPDRTSSSGRWDSSEYQTIGYIINLSGVLVFDTDNFDSDEIIKNMIQFSYLKFRVNFTAADGTIKSYQGTCTVDSASLSMAVADVVKGSFKLTGRGEPMRFNGLVPCDSAITDILFSGLSDPSGTVTITYTYTGLPYQVKYRADGAGPYLYALVDQPIVLYGQSVGLHLFEIIPVCSNDYDGTALQKDYTVTKDLSCSAEISDIAISDSYSASNTHTVGVTTMQYRIDGGVDNSKHRHPHRCRWPVGWQSYHRGGSYLRQRNTWHWIYEEFLYICATGSVCHNLYIFRRHYHLAIIQDNC